nr:hypothetical protein [Clostridia bacterium]
MTTLMRSRMRRQTRPAKYMSRSCQAESAAWSRPGNGTFSFTGDFPGVAEDQQPVEATNRRRNYTEAGRNTGAYRAVSHEDTCRTPVICKYGLRYGAAMVAFVLMLGVFAALIGAELHQQGQLLTVVKAYDVESENLRAACKQTRENILQESDGVLVRQKALLLGMIDSAGVEVRTLQEPQNADITLAEQVLPLSLASIWGQ